MPHWKVPFWPATAHPRLIRLVWLRSAQSRPGPRWYASWGCYTGARSQKLCGIPRCWPCTAQWPWSWASSAVASSTTSAMTSPARRTAWVRVRLEPCAYTPATSGDHASMGRAPAVRSEASCELVRGGAGAVFFSLVFLALTSLTTVDLLVNERGLVVKETLGGYYRPISYYLSKGADSPSAAAHTLNALPIC